MSGRTLRLYRLDVTSWPTPDGRPFDQQPDDWWADVVLVEAGNPAPDGWKHPDWLPADFLEWVPDMDPMHGGGPRPGSWLQDAELVVPRVPTRRHWIDRSAAERRANVLRSWGATVTVTPSNPITWPVPS